MRVALATPQWSFDHSIYFGCREAHLPLEYGSAKALLQHAGHVAQIFDGHLFDLGHAELANEIRGFKPDITVLTTAPSYLFWRCAPPELRVPQELFEHLRGIAPLSVVVGPHASTTPRATLKKIPANFAIMGECEELLVSLASGTGTGTPGLARRCDEDVEVCGGPVATRFSDLPPIRWESEWITRHHHHHHRFDAPPEGPGAEVEASRGCPYHCTFCAKDNFRDGYRRRNLEPLLLEIDALIAQGVTYFYFIDEIFLPNRPLLKALAVRNIKFGVQTRIDLWKPDMIRLLGEAGCVSIEAGVESLSREGRDVLDKECRLSTNELSDRLVLAKQYVPFVQANLIEMAEDDDDEIQRWRERMRTAGVWANDPVPLFPYPGSPDYRRLWGIPDDNAWERAVSFYLSQYGGFSDIQDQQPLPLHQIERMHAA
jgi:B12-binding domain/radical SAM domain protein of rhizo-twelve system